MMYRTPPPSRQQGVALITVISVIAFLVVLVTQLAVRLNRDVRITQYVMESRQASWLAQGVENWATQTLALDSRESEQDDLTESWAQELPSTLVEHGAVTAQIDDLQGRLNLNALVRDGKRHEPQVARLKRLFRLLDIDVNLVEGLVDWIDEDQQVTFPHGAEDSHYLNKSPGYRAANVPLSSVAELQMIKGMTQDIVTRLQPHVAALPAAVVGININTAGPLVLAALADGVTAQEGEQLVGEREDNGPFSLEQFVQHPVFAGRTLAPQDLVQVSSYFEVTADVRYQDVSLRRVAKLWRDKDKQVHVIGRRSS